MIHCNLHAVPRTGRPRTGRPRRGGRLDGVIRGRDRSHDAIFENGMVYVSVEDQHPRRAVIDQQDFSRITAYDPSGPRLTRTRWFLDDDNMLRAYSLHEKPMAHGVLVAAAILGVSEGACIEVPAGPRPCPRDLPHAGLRRLAW